MAAAVVGDHVTGVDGDATRHGRPSSGERSYRGSPRLDRPCRAWFSSGTMRVPTLGLKRKQWEPLAFASPSMALIALVIVFPLAYSFYLSFQNFDLSVGPEYEFVGAKNYTEAIFNDPRFMGSVWNTALLIGPSLVLELLLGLGIALLLSRVLRGRPIITALLVVPSMVSPVMAAMAWRMMFGVKYGAINNLGRQLGIIDVYFDWFATPLLSIASVVLVEVWHNTPFMMLVLLAGLQSIPPELFESARAAAARRLAPAACASPAARHGGPGVDGRGRRAGLLSRPLLLDRHHVAQRQRGLLRVSAGMDPARRVAQALRRPLHALERRALL